MGYDRQEIVIPVRLERHNGPGDVADNEALERLEREIHMLIESDPDFRRIAGSG